ncbi:MAG: hypothetical protein E7442_04935 [Ruminococcaceae bacterium]|nr:hypothetical protein [Oscillospiraceae bacterium]
MKEYLYLAVGIVAKLHDIIMHLNDRYETNFTDKELHFLVIGLLGMGLVLVLFPIFRYLARHNHELTITWIYVFTLIIVITFAIEIGQKITGTGNMEFSDIAFGIVGFLFLFLIYALLRAVWLFIIKKIRRKQKD